MAENNAAQHGAGDLILIGWREWVSLPGLSSTPIKAKIDTGAKTSALHAFFIEPYEANGVRMVKFLFHPIQRDTDTVVECHTPVVDQRMVRDSGGHQEMRYVVKSGFMFGGLQFDAEITLTDRDSMVFRMLLGRNVLANRFLVQSSASFLLGGTRKSPSRKVRGILPVQHLVIG